MNDPKSSPRTTLLRGDAALLRAVGSFALTAAVINVIVGGGIFRMPSALGRLRLALAQSATEPGTTMLLLSSLGKPSALPLMRRKCRRVSRGARTGQVRHLWKFLGACGRQAGALLPTNRNSRAHRSPQTNEQMMCQCFRRLWR
jgi:hypothetical protein